MSNNFPKILPVLFCFTRLNCGVYVYHIAPLWLLTPILPLLMADCKLKKISNILIVLLGIWYILQQLLPLAIIMIHEWWGINDNIRTMANTLAKQAGYVVLAVDLFKGQSTKDPNQAMQLVKIVTDNPQQSISNLQAAVKYVSSLPFVDNSKVASIGWCFGGGQSLQLSLYSEQHPLVATILYYGTPLVTDKQELSKIKWPVLGIFGDHDQANPLPLINSFKAALDASGITNQIQIYKGLGHAFANPSGCTTTNCRCLGQDIGVS